MVTKSKLEISVMEFSRLGKKREVIKTPQFPSFGNPKSLIKIVLSTTSILKFDHTAGYSRLSNFNESIDYKKQDDVLVFGKKLISDD